jgi:ribonuclease P protein component
MEFRCETHISTKRSGAQKAAWIPLPQRHQERHESSRTAPLEGPQEPLGLESISVRAGEPLIPLGRLTKRAEFLRVRDGRAWRAPSLVLQARARPDGSLPDSEKAHFGFTATRRLGNAVARNRARRRLKETVRLVAHAHARPGYDYVVIARQGALTQSFEHIQKELRQALDGIHKDNPARA